METLEILRNLIRFKTITPEDDGIINYIISILKRFGFGCHIIISGAVKNLFAVRGGTNLCYGCHVDVVSAGNLSGWHSNPFDLHIDGENLVGRGIVDMKGSIACFISSIMKSRSDNICIMITGDEEIGSEDGTRSILAWLKNRNIKLKNVLIGEPTSINYVGDNIKNGRRGSMNMDLEILGIQGHTAYPDIAINPVHVLNNILHEIISYKLDDGTSFFPESKPQIVSIDVGNKTYNITPQSAHAKLNIRYNDLHDAESLYKIYNKICEKYSSNFVLAYEYSGNAFVTKDQYMTNMAKNAISQAANLHASVINNGGTSDARFIKDYASSIIECGLKYDTAHKMNEQCSKHDLEILEKIYDNIIIGINNGHR